MTIGISTMISVLGWLVGAFWAIQQVKFAHQKNIDLQRSLLIQNVKNNLSHEFLNIHLNTCNSILELKNAISHLLNNMKMAEISESHDITFGWQNLIEPISEVYSKTCKNFDHLEIWLNTSEEYIENGKEIFRIIENFNMDFTLKDKYTINHPWCAYQTTITAIQINREPDAEKLNLDYLKIKESLDGILVDMKTQAKLIQKRLLTPELKSI
jgi:hypothetical protein